MLKRFFREWKCGSAALLLLPCSVFAQNDRTIRGTVRAAETGVPIAGARIA